MPRRASTRLRTSADTRGPSSSSAAAVATSSSAPASASTLFMSIGTTASSAAHSALTVNKPRLGGQSISTRS
jgi:hypothetical protein